MGRLEADLAQPVGLVILRRQRDALSRQLLAVNMLELGLNELDRILFLKFPHEENAKVEHLLHLHRIDFDLICLLLNRGDRRRES